MNKYCIAIHDMQAWDTWIISFNAKSLNDCHDKIAEYFSNYFKDDDLLNMDYTDLIDELDKKDICISETYDIEEL